MANTIQCKEVAPGVLIQEGVRFGAKAAQTYFSPLVGKTISKVILQESEDSVDPRIILEFEQGGAAEILMDPEGNGPGFIEYLAD